MTGKAIAHHMQAIFAKYRWPNTLVTENGPCYTSKEFQMLMESMSVNHITSSPHYPQSNGLVEKFVGIIKSLFHKAKEEGQFPYMALMVYRNTPLNGSLQSPMQILQGRQAHTDLPLSHAAKVKMGINHTPRPTAEILCVKDWSLSAPTHDLPIGQHVMYREPTHGRWYPVTVIQRLPQKRSYIIKTLDNVMYRKMQVHLKPYTPKKNVQHPKLHKVDNNQTVTKTRGLNVLVKHQTDSIYDSYMTCQLYLVHTYEVSCPTMLEMSYILPPHHVKRNTFLYTFWSLSANWPPRADNCSVAQKLTFIV